MKLNSYLKQKYPKGIEDPNMRAKTTKFLEENIGINLHDLGFDNGFIYMTSKAQGNKRLIGFHQN